MFILISQNDDCFVVSCSGLFLAIVKWLSCMLMCTDGEVIRT